MGWVDPTPIQLRAIPLLLEGRDVIGSAQTGTGKTGAFALPFISKLGKKHGRTRVLIIEPTRELASQVETAIRDYARFTDLTVAVIYGRPCLSPCPDGPIDFFGVMRIDACVSMVIYTGGRGGRIYITRKNPCIPCKALGLDGVELAVH